MREALDSAMRCRFLLSISASELRSTETSLKSNTRGKNGSCVLKKGRSFILLNINQIFFLSSKTL